MEQLRVVGSEDGCLILATESGHRFALVVDEVLRSELRRSHRARDERPRAPRPNPRDIQARIRAGMSSGDIAQSLGVTADDVARYEGPVLAEREHVLDMALAVPVFAAGDIDHDTMPTFGAAVRTKLADADASGERWSSWKEASGWIVKLEFRAADVDHDARWDFDPRRGTLSPRNSDATQLSRQGSLPDGLIPRLRALDSPHVGAAPAAPGNAEPAVRPLWPAVTDDEVASTAAEFAAIKRAPEPSHTSAQTADLLQALRRRRGQRAVPESDAVPPTHTQHPAVHHPAGQHPVTLLDERDTPDGEPTRTSRPLDAPAVPPPTSDTRRKGRTAMPSWDEIVFGARSEDS